MKQEKRETRNDYIIVIKENGKIVLQDMMVGFSIPRAFEALRGWVNIYKDKNYTKVDDDCETTLSLIRSGENKVIRQITVKGNGGAK